MVIVPLFIPGQPGNVESASIPGAGFTVIVYEEGVPAQLPAEGVTVIVATIADELPFIALNVGKLPLPPAASPMAGLELVQLNVAPATGPVNVNPETVVPEHTVLFPGTVTVAVGSTVILNEDGAPWQPLAFGVTVMTAVMAALPVLYAVKAGILPVPPAGNPIDVFELVHVNVVPDVALLNVKPDTTAPLQISASDGTVTSGEGFTVMVKLVGIPAQPLADAVTDMVAIIGSDVVFVAVKPGMLPVPDAARPIEELLFVQVKATPGVELVRVIAAIAVPLQKVVSFTGVTVGAGFTVMV